MDFQHCEHYLKIEVMTLIGDNKKLITFYDAKVLITDNYLIIRTESDSVDLMIIYKHLKLNLVDIEEFRCYKQINK